MHRRQWRFVQGHPVRAGEHRHRSHRHLHGNRDPVEIRSDPRGRHCHLGNGPRSHPSGRRGIRCGWPALGAGQEHDLQRHDVPRRAESGSSHRLHQRLMDPEVRPDQPVRLPPDQLHGQARLPILRAAHQRSDHHRIAVCRFLIRLYSARHRQVPQARVESALEALPELCARHSESEIWRREG